MRLDSSELVFFHYKWVVKDTDYSSNDRQFVSPFFDLDISPHLRKAKNLRFGLRLRKAGDCFEAVVYLYVHYLDLFSVGITDVECFVENDQYRMVTKFRDSKTLIFESHQFCIPNNFLGDKAELVFSIYPSNAAFSYTLGQQSLPSYGFCQMDTNFGEEMWQAACSRTYTDCEFIVNRSVFPAHRAIIAARCPALVDWHDFDLQSKPRIAVLDMHDYFQAFLYFIYTGQVMDMNSDMYPSFAQLVADFVDRDPEELVCSSSQPGEVDEPSLDIGSTVIISENHGKVKLIRRGVSLEYSYKARFKSSEKPATQKIFVHGKGSFKVGLQALETTESQCECQLSLTPRETAKGLNVVNVNCYQQGKKHFLTPLGCKHVGTFTLPLSPLRPKDSSLPHEAKMPKNSERGQYFIVTDMEISMVETCQSWGFRLRDQLLASHLWSIYLSKENWDVELRLVGETFYAHRAILAARSRVFARSFDAADSGSVIDIDLDDPILFEDFLYFIYTGTLRSMENLEELLQLATTYAIKTLEVLSKPN